MTFALMLLGLAAFAQDSVGAQANDGVPDDAPAGAISREEAAARLTNCGVRRFETSAEGMINGRMRRTSIRLCAKDTESNAEWLVKLERSAAQVEAQTMLPDSVKLKLLTDLRREIARISANRPAAAAIAAGEPEQTAGASTGEAMGEAAAEPVEVAEARADGVTEETIADPLETELSTTSGKPVEQEISSPRAETSPSPPTVGVAPMPSPAPPALPNLVIRCHAPGDPLSGTDCDNMTVDAVMLVKPEGTLPAGSRLRFKREGGGRVTDVVLSDRPVRMGQTLRVKVPASICARAFRTEFTVQLMAAGSVDPVGNYGPFAARCN